MSTLDFETWLYSEYYLTAEDFSKEDKNTKSRIRKEYEEYVKNNGKQ